MQVEDHVLQSAGVLLVCVQILLVETIHSFGLCLLLFRVLPCLDTVRCLLLMNALCSVPAALRLLATKRSEEPRRKVTTIILDVLAVLMQLSAYVVVLVSMKSECVQVNKDTTDDSQAAARGKREAHLSRLPVSSNSLVYLSHLTLVYLTASAQQTFVQRICVSLAAGVMRVRCNTRHWNYFT